MGDKLHLNFGAKFQLLEFWQNAREIISQFHSSPFDYTY